MSDPKNDISVREKIQRQLIKIKSEELAKRAINRNLDDEKLVNEICDEISKSKLQAFGSMQTLGDLRYVHAIEEKLLIVKAMILTNWIKVDAARILDIGESTLRSLIKRYDLDSEFARRGK